MRRRKVRYQVQQKDRRRWPLALFLLVIVLLLPLPGSSPSMAPLSYLMRFTSSAPNWLIEPSGGGNLSSTGKGSSVGGRYLDSSVISETPQLDWMNTESFRSQPVGGTGGRRGSGGPAGSPASFDSAVLEAASVVDTWLGEGFSAASLAGFAGGNSGGGSSPVGSSGGGSASSGGGEGFGPGGSNYKPQYVENFKPGGGVNPKPGDKTDPGSGSTDPRPDDSKTVPEPGLVLLTVLGLAGVVARKAFSGR